MSDTKILDLLTTPEFQEKFKTQENWKVLLHLLSQESESNPNVPKPIKEIFKDKYGTSFTASNEFERIYNIVQLYTYVYVQRGITKTTIRRKLIEILAFYVLEGKINRKTRKKAEEMFGIRTETVNSLNCSLRSFGFIVRNPMRSGDDSLNPDLEALRKYYLKTGQEPFLFQISISL